ncbi:MAG: 3-oxoacyl-ACP reductase [Anaerolineaceae bacterium 4572_32.2]|nr:MAG: 3-oxoacyl-ACP reductase [Anaerolineaceae bacterium 4572_32.2]
MSRGELEGRWALILGASSGFGAATARALAGAGMNVFGVHLDTKATLPRARQVAADIEALGRRAVFFNTNAADARKRARALDKVVETLADDPADSVHFMLHSLAFGSLGPLIADDPEEAIGESQMEMTLRVMAHSLVYWVQDLARRNLLVRGSRVYALSSAGAVRVAPMYGAVSAAKAALESHTRQLALELGPRGIAVNCLRPGVAETPALRAIPGHEPYVDKALEINPGGRLTTTDDVANVLLALADPAVAWISGAVIPVDGGEIIVG